MTKYSRLGRMGVPVAIVMIIMIISVNGYDFTTTVKHYGLHQFLATLFGLLMFATIWLGGFIANPVAYFMGASFKERILVCLATPFVHAVKIVYGFSGIYSTGETYFLFLHSLVFGPMMISLLCMGISEIFCRIIHNKKEKNAVPVFARGNTILLVLTAVMTILCLRSGGHWYYHEIFTPLFYSIFS